MGRCGWESSDQFLLDFLLLHSHKLKHLVLFSTSSTFPFTHYFLYCRLILPSTLYFTLGVSVMLSPVPSLPSSGSLVVAAVLRTDPQRIPRPQWEAGKVGVQEGHPRCYPWVRCPHSSALECGGGHWLCLQSPILQTAETAPEEWSSGVLPAGALGVKSARDRDQGSSEILLLLLPILLLWWKRLMGLFVLESVNCSRAA